MEYQQTHNLSDASVAHALGVSPITWYRWRTGRSQPQRVNMERLYITFPDLFVNTGGTDNRVNKIKRWWQKCTKRDTR